MLGFSCLSEYAGFAFFIFLMECFIIERQLIHRIVVLRVTAAEYWAVDVITY